MEFRINTRSPFYAQYESLPAEVESTNIAPHSEDLSSWNKVNATVTTDQVSAPDGSLTADKLERNSKSASYAQVTANRTSTSINDYSCSVFVKKGNTRYVSIRVNASYSNRLDFQYDFEAGTLIRFNANGSGTINSRTVESGFVDGWVRICFNVGVASVGSTVSMYLSPKQDSNENIDSSDTNGAAGDFVYVWGSQIEEDSTSCTSYIANTGSGTTLRAATTETNESLVTCSLFIYSGDSVNDRPLVPTYVLEANPTNGLATFEVSELIRDYIDQSHHNPSNSSGAIWASLKLVDSVQLIKGYELFCTEGYINSSAGFQFHRSASSLSVTGFQSIMQSNNTVFIPPSETMLIPFYASSDASYSIDGVVTNLADNNNSDSQIQYAEVSSTDSAIEFIKDGSTYATVTINEAECSKYESKRIVFVNKFGARQDFYFNMKSTSEVKIEDKTHNVNTLDFSNFFANSNKHNVKRRITGSKVSHILNTGFIDEVNAEVLEELLVSEYVWIYTNGFTSTPVIIKDSNIERKTNLNDGLIQYTINVEETVPYLNNFR